MPTMIKFPSINQFRNVVQHVQQQARFMGLDAEGNAIMNPAPVYPILVFKGRVKLHGTNAAIVFTKNSMHFQSRERIIVPGDDNAGFAAHMADRSLPLACLYTNLAKQHKVNIQEEHSIAVYGEWCGSNIQKGVAIAALPKMFVIFKVKVNGSWVPMPDFWCSGFALSSIYNIDHFPSWVETINFENPAVSQNRLALITQKVEEECPVAKYFGFSGTGEGVVWECVSNPSSEYWFKVKGKKHSASKVKTLAAVDVEAIESIKAFVNSAVTDARLEQGLQNLINEQKKPFAMTSMGDFIRWVHNDVMKEEADTIQANGFDHKKLGGPIATASKRWFTQKLNEQVMA